MKARAHPAAGAAASTSAPISTAQPAVPVDGDMPPVSDLELIGVASHHVLRGVIKCARQNDPVVRLLCDTA